MGLSIAGAGGVAQNRGAVLIGSGPSLNRIELRSLVGRPTISFNRAYLAWPKWPFEPDFHACFDPALVLQIAADIRALVRETRTHFFLHEAAAKVGFLASERVSLVATRPGDGFASSVEVLVDFGNAGATSLQILWLAGYRRILLVGVDGRYHTPAALDHEAVAAGTNDPDHFFARYRAELALDAGADGNLAMSGWGRAAAECTGRGIMVRNASSGTALDCFPICDLETGLDWLNEAPLGR